MNITILTNRDAASALSLELLSKALSGHNLSVFCTQKQTTHSEQLDTTLKQLGQFESVLLERTSTFERLGAQKLNKINTGEDFKRFASTNPDLVISVRHMSILQAPTIKVAKHGVINLHSGLLPQYQGVMATFWAMLNRETEIGTTLHYIVDSSIDTGPIIQRSQQAADYQHSYFWNVLSLYTQGCSNIVDAVNRIDAGNKIEAQTQVGPAHYYSYPTAKDFEQFNGQLFESSDTIDDFI